MTEASAHRQPFLELSQPLGALVLGLGLLGGGLMWLRFGDAIYLERLFSAAAGCF